MMLRFSLLFLAVGTAACNTSESCDCVPLPDHDVEITQGAPSKGPNAFSPSNIVISLASQTTVTWLNQDFSGTGPYGGGSGVTHRLVSNDGTTFTSGNIASNGTYTATLSAPGTYGYHCSIHPGMTGTVTVDP